MISIQRAAAAAALVLSAILPSPMALADDRPVVRICTDNADDMGLEAARLLAEASAQTPIRLERADAGCSLFIRTADSWAVTRQYVHLPSPETLIGPLYRVNLHWLCNRSSRIESSDDVKDGGATLYLANGRRTSTVYGNTTFIRSAETLLIERLVLDDRPTWGRFSWKEVALDEMAARLDQGGCMLRFGPARDPFVAKLSEEHGDKVRLVPSGATLNVLVAEMGEEAGFHLSTIPAGAYPGLRQAGFMARFQSTDSVAFDVYLTATPKFLEYVSPAAMGIVRDLYEQTLPAIQAQAGE